jgi:hypothetical protein
LGGVDGGDAEFELLGDVLGEFGGEEGVSSYGLGAVG